MKTSPTVCCLIFAPVILANLAFGPAIRAQDARPTETPAQGSLVVIGASASAGFVSSEPFGGSKTPQYRFSRYLSAALADPGIPAKNLASSTFFLMVDDQARRQIDAAVKAKPSAVVGIDFLFWFFYGKVSAESERAAKFEKGLAYLERLSCPLVIGDIPDASPAAGGMLNANEIPKPEAITAANHRLAEWASAHHNVSLVSLNEFMSACLANRALTIGTINWPEGQTRKLLQSDKLHPARHGCAVLALAVMNALTKERGVFSEKDVRWDVEEIFRRAVEMPSTPATSTPSTK
jgi:hypothetical protein